MKGAATRHRSAVADARRLAYDALIAVEQRPVFVNQVLDELFAARNPAADDRRLAREIAAGVVRRRQTIDTLLNHHTARPQAEIEPELWTLLRVGIYQLVFLTIPAHACVHETVELARRLNRVRWTRFVNGILRSVQRDLTDEYGDAPRSDAVPLVDLEQESLSVTHRRLGSSVFPPPQEDIAAYVAQAFSLPGWLAERWNRQVGGDELVRRATWFTTPGRMSLRVNLLKTDRDTVLEVLRTAGVDASAGEWPEAIRLGQLVRVENIPGFAEGWFSVQDKSAMGAAHLLDPQPGERVLDLCAAPGGKTAHLAERMQDSGRILAVDVDENRLNLVQEGAQRLGLKSIETRLIRPDLSDLSDESFDRVLVDVPCSNTGVLGKRPEARWRISADGISELSQLQQRLLQGAAARLATPGRLVYSTCSIEPQENEEVVAAVLRENAGLRLECERRHAPGQPGDGGYQAAIARVA